MAPRKIGPKGMRGMQRTGNTISDIDKAALLTMMGESGNTISDADRARLQAIKGSGKSISNADMARIQKLLGSMKSPQPKTDRQLMQFEDGGKVKKPKTTPKPKTLPKPKPKIGDLNEMGPIYTDTKTGKKVKRMENGGALSQTLEITPEMLELIREMKKSGKNFRPKKIEPFIPPTESQIKAAKKLKPINYKKGGAAFPDLTGDGKVTKKDILKGRGVKGFKDGGKTISDADRKKVDSILGESGKTISDSDMKRVKKMVSGVTQESGKTISNSDKKRVKKIASGFKDGGEVRGMGKAYMGAPRKTKIR